MIVKIAVSAATFAIDKPYSYRIPENMALTPGQRVLVPFGRGNRRTEGIVLAVEPDLPGELKTVELCLDETPVLTAYQLRLAAFLRERYFCTFYDAIHAILPAGLWFRTRAQFSLTEDKTWQEKQLRKPLAMEILRFLEELGGNADEDALRKQFPQEETLEDALDYLLKKKWLESKTDYLRRAGDKTEKIATLAVTPEQAQAFTARRMGSMQRSVMELMNSVGSAAVKEICYYTGASAATVNRLEKLGYLTLSERPVLRCREIRPAAISGELVLSPAQQAAYEGLSAQRRREKPGAALLYGVTGSGKTSVYIRLIQDCLAEGKAAMLLVPEIGLTPQLLGILAAYFGNRVAVLHSSLPAGERYDQWKRVRSGEAGVIVGTRSAVFAPCVSPGILILDEEQEHSYKSENAPRYDAREIALWRGMKENTLVLFGSATPSVETMYHARKGDYARYTLPGRYNGGELPPVEIVDLREELKEGNDLSVSYPLLDAIRETRLAGKQTILLLNRRGNSRALVCVDCGQAPECPRCSVRMTYHSANHRLMCHYCGFSQAAPERCPVCGGPLKTIGTGTQKVQQELENCFPDAKILRMDADTVSAANPHEKILEDFRNTRGGILVGTQMVAKGLNLPDVTLVGVLDGDLSLYSGGYRSAETTFNMLTQVVGRAGRGDTPGRAFIQTLVPKHQVIALAARQDYPGFFELEIQVRRALQMPPFGDVATVTFVGREESLVLRCATKFRDSLRACLAGKEYAAQRCTCLGPAPCPVPKVNFNFRYRLTCNCRMTRELRRLLAWLLIQFGKDKTCRGVSAFVDVNGLE